MKLGTSIWIKWWVPVPDFSFIQFCAQCLVHFSPLVLCE